MDANRNRLPQKRNKGGSKQFGRRRLAMETLETRRLLAFDPTGFEQEVLEHTNRMRMYPSEELGVWFDNHPQPLVATDPDVQASIDFFHVDGTVLESQWSHLRPAAPLAWDPSLLNAARAHSEAMIAADRQAHHLPGEASLGERVSQSGYGPYQALAENLFAFALSPEHAHAAFAIDWGRSETGIQDGHGHRNNLMNSEFTEVGMGILEQDAAQAEVGPLVVTQNFGRPLSTTPWLMGVVYEDSNENGRYDAGEGLAGVPVHVQAADGAFYTAETMSAGGYQLNVPPGTYQVSIDLPGSHESMMVDQVVVAANNVKVDFLVESVHGEPGDPRSPWQNPEDPCDVDGDGVITPKDALLIINLLNERGVHRLTGTPSPGEWWDVNGDGLVTAQDVLIVVNRLNAGWPGSEGPISVSAPRGGDRAPQGEIDWGDTDFGLDHFDGWRAFPAVCGVRAPVLSNVSSEGDPYGPALTELLGWEMEEDSLFDPLFDEAIDLLAGAGSEGGRNR